MGGGKMVDALAPLTLAVAQPACVPCDVDQNARTHAAAVLSAKSRVVVFPELSLTGYELGDAPVVDIDSPLLAPLVEACARRGSVAFAGAPVADADGRVFIATLAVSGSGTTVAYCKMWIGSDEAHRFQPGERPARYEVDGWRLGLAICKDTGTTEHSAATAALGVDAYLAGLVMHDHEADEQNDRAARIARDHGVPVAFASFAGPTGSGYDATAGRSGIWAPDGTALAQVGPEPGEIACTTLRART